ncbi:MAG: hypothetical protein L6Q65_12275 [Zoogloea sp.]|nr:hypothetical protein [Zoogloea sp.]
MTTTPSRRVPAMVLADDIKAFQALPTIEGYAPHDPELKLDAVTATFDELSADQAAFVRAQVAMDAARDKLAHTEQRAHQKMLGVKKSVCSQYGDDSNEYAALGMKKKSEKKKGGGKAKPAE